MEDTYVSVKNTADSTCDLPRALQERHAITITPLYIEDGEETHRDGVDLTRDDLLRMVEQENRRFSTAAVNVDDYREVFSRLREDGSEIVHFTISSDMSSCYQNACLAAQEVGGVYVVDSRSLSSGIALLALDAAEMAEEGKTAEEIFRTLEEKKHRLDVSFVLETLEYLSRGGRCSSLAAFGANLMQIRPCIEVKAGKMGVGRKYRGQLTRCMLKYIRERLADADTLDLRRIFYTDSGLDEEAYRQIEETIRECAPFAEIIHGDAGCTISNHCGPHCMGILFYRK